MKIKTITEKAKEIDDKAKVLSQEMSTKEYTITMEKIDIPLKQMKKLIQRMSFTNAETDKIILSVRNDLVEKKMIAGDDFKALITESFTKAITNAIEGIKKDK